MYRYVDTVDEIVDLKNWFSEQSYVAFDTETTGLNTYEPGFNVRLMQFGNANEAWVMDCGRWVGFIDDIFRDFRGRFVAHNSAYDVAALRAVGITVPWEKVDDTMIAMKIAEPHKSAALKGITERLISSRAAESQAMLNQAMKKNKWDWSTVPHDLPEYRFYAGMDVILTSRLYEHEICRGGLNSPVYEMEMDVRAIASRMEEGGMRVDIPFARSTGARLRDEAEQLANDIEQAHGFSISSGPQLARWLIDHGVKLSVLTAKGAASTSKDALEAARYSATGEAADVMDAVLRSRKITKLASSYFDNFVDMSTDGLLHPQIQTIQARTGRMCIPDDHLLLTRRGVLKIDDVVVGDETLDEAGNWVEVEDIHRYHDQEVDVWRSNTATLECTSEHRWVSYSERGVRYLAPIGPRRTIRLAPADLFDPTEIVPVYEPGNIAALIGWLVSDGRCAESGNGLRAYIYQSEDKFYSAALRAIPREAIMYDRITKSGVRHHEIRLKTRWLRPVLDGLGLRNDRPAEDPNLPRWVSSLPLRDCHAFLQAVWLADGSTSHPQNQKIACQHEPLREAIQIAAYRCGKVSHITNDGIAGWATKDRLGVKMKRPTAHTRNLIRGVKQSDVWCVTTSTGTFTAWKDGPYLTGNSITSPAMQTLPRNSDDPDSKLVRQAIIPREEDHVLIGSDFSQVELRVIASLSEDPGLIEAFREADETGGDLFTSSMRLVYGDPSLTKDDDRRTLVKSVMYAASYGAGVAKMAQTAGVAVDEMREVYDAVFGRFSGVKKYMKVCEREARENDNWITTPHGRKIWIDPEFSYKALNAKVQGFAGDIFKQTMVDLAHAGLVDYMVCPIHDEVLFSIPEDEAEDVRQTIAEIMPYNELTVPVPAEPSPGVKDWSQAK